MENNNEIYIGDYSMTIKEYDEYFLSYGSYLDNFFEGIEETIMDNFFNNQLI